MKTRKEQAAALAHHGMRKMAKGAAHEMEPILVAFLETVMDAARKDAFAECATVADENDDVRGNGSAIAAKIRARGVS